MDQLDTTIRNFFDRYARITNRALQAPPVTDSEELAACFAPYFVGSAPQGVFGSANDANFLTVMEKGFAHYRQIGGKAMAITDVRVRPLDAVHASAEVDWDFAYRNSAGTEGNVRFTNIYFVTTAGGQPKIFAYITADEEKAKREHGLV